MYDDKKEKLFIDNDLLIVVSNTSKL